jgi:hypothetical protein
MRGQERQAPPHHRLLRLQIQTKLAMLQPVTVQDETDPRHTKLRVKLESLPVDLGHRDLTRGSMKSHSDVPARRR